VIRRILGGELTDAAPELHDADKTLTEIRKKLAATGCKGVVVSYAADGTPEAVVFVIATRYGERSFRLPARAEAVEATLKRQAQKGKVPRRLATREQAARVAWRITKDWLEAQLAIVESGMVELDEVMFPYMLDARSRTAVEAYREQQIQLNGPGK
jgi:hypothetical protein